VARNVEVKARLADVDGARALVAGLGAVFVWTDEQVDRYYELDGGRRLKLRTCGRAAAQLIRYDRPETSGIRASDYEITPVRDDAAAACLVPKTPPLVTVRKRRELWQLENVRIHLDEVDGLGTFLELEAIVDGAYDERACTRAVERLLAALDLRAADCIRASYSDLLRA
jgi:adenylate cyclase class 2